MKKVIVIALAVSMLLSLAACATTANTTTTAAQAATTAAQAATTEAKTAGDLNVDTGIKETADVKAANYNFAIVYGGVHPFFDPWRFGAQAAAKDLGIPTPNVTSPQNWDQTEQNAIIDGLVAGGIGGIGMFTSDAVAGNEKITELVGMGIPVVTMGGSPATPSKASFCYATDVGASVAFATQAIIDELKAQGKTEGKLLHLCSSLADTNTQKRQAAIKEVLAKPENAGFTLGWELADTDATEPAEKAISSMYSSYVKEVSGIICTGYVNAQVLAKTMNERKSNDGIVAIGIDDSADVLSAISNGYMFGTMTQSSWAMGYVGTYALKLFADGYTYNPAKDFFINSGFFLLKKDGLSTYQATQEKMAKDFVSTMKETYFIAPVK